VRASHARICIPPKKNLKLSVCAAEPLIFAQPHPSRALRGEGRIPFELFLKYTAKFDFLKINRLAYPSEALVKAGTIFYLRWA